MIERLRELSGSERIYARSVTEWEGTTYFLARNGDSRHDGVGTKVLGVIGETTGFAGELRGEVMVCPLNAENAAALRARLPWLHPVPLGLTTSAGCGDRLGLATPGHIQALRAVSGTIAPIWAQQSMRENARTGRSPQDVMDDALWGVFQEGWRDAWGADADHLKTPEDIDYCAAAGFTWYTFDPRDHVDNDAEEDAVEVLEEKYRALPWDALASTAEDTRKAYVGREWRLEGYTLGLNEEDLLRAACKYGRALAHLAAMYRHLAAVMGDRPFEVEVSVDETETPTKPHEHLYIATELKRLGLEWTSLAPRYIGRFEKGVDYIGDLGAFEETFAQHVAIAKAVGPYKLSLHSGSDKFSIYPIAARLAGDLVHLKTAGTSYLEALRAVARVDPALFREILAFAIEHYEEDKASYHVSADVAKMIAPDSVSDEALPDVLNQFDTRQALHVTFGSVLTLRDGDGRSVFKDRLYRVLEANETEHYAALESHIVKHVTPFSD